MTRAKRKGAPARGRRRRGRPRPASNRPVPLHKRSASHFQRGDRQRGLDYFQEGRVHLQIDGDRARARVEGTEQPSYGVGLDWSKIEDRVLHAFCECQRFADRKPCKHLWATLLALAEIEPEQQPPGRDRVSLRKDAAASWQDLGIAVDLEGYPVRPARAGRAHHARPARHRRVPKTESATTLWRSQLATVRDQVNRRSDGRSTGRRGGKPAHPAAPAFDIHLLINIVASHATANLVLDVFGHKPGRRPPAPKTRPAKLKRAHIVPEQLERILLPPSLSGSTSEAQEDPPPEGPEETSPAGASEPREKSAEMSSEASAEGSPETSAEVSSPPFTIIPALPPDPPARRGGRPRGRGPAKSQGAQIQRFRFPRQLYLPLLPQLCKRGILSWWDGRKIGDPRPLSWDPNPWHLALHLQVTEAGGGRLSGSFEREGAKIPLKEARLILPLGSEDSSGADSDRAETALVLFGHSLSLLETNPEGDFPWIALLRENGEIFLPKEDLEEALTTLLELPGLPRLEAPEQLQLSELESELRPRLLLEPEPASVLPDPPLLAELSFVYGGFPVSASDTRRAVVDWQERRFVRRDMDGEHGALVRLLEAGLRPITLADGHALELSPHELPTVVKPLLADGWEVEVHGTTLRPASPPSLRVESGIDWFELSGGVDFDGDPVELSTILEAISRGDHFIKLDDGSRGLLPASLVETYDSLAKLAQDSTGDGLRFLPSQALLVDALLAAMPPADVDGAFTELRQKLASFDRIKPKRELKTFEGELRGYQRHGLGWLTFLREFGLGGVLADDMGLGKTVQVLALLQAHRTPSKTTKLASLVVAPRSLLYNWIEEAARFIPKLKVVEYAGPDREALHPKLGKQDLVVTTYGTLRRDVGYLATVEFDTVILDEAQAIKNPTSQTAKASRALKARHRLALTGTPIENHLGELGSLFEFLNPGLLGRLPQLEVLTSGRAASQQELVLVAKGIRPFILRRTKAEVLPDLPAKTEQVLYCSLRPRQREFYDQVRAGYQASLLKQVETKGVGGSAIQVLEALLRLRQVACHPALVNEEWEEAGSAKLEALFEQVFEILDEGHKILVFSQFTKLLGHVRKHLDENEVTYAYLDGQTRNRAEVVESFQSDNGCNLFLISLKAGGVGLNLTAAGYVFLLDPWWNPAVEAQAIDRIHRIGQTQPVFAYRMIARDTVEEKIVELQRSKRQVADAVLDGEGLPLRDLTADDLRMLLS